MAFLTRTKGNLAEKVIITLVFEKNAYFFAENWQKSQKMVIITSVPGSNLTDGMEAGHRRRNSGEEGVDAAEVDVGGAKSRVHAERNVILGSML
jgi:hypothetical protein